MNKKIFIVSLVLISLLILTGNGCNKQNQRDNSNISNAQSVLTNEITTKKATNKDTTSKKETTEKITTYIEDKNNYDNITIVIPNTNTDETEKVAEELSKLTENVLNLKLNFIYMRSFQMIPNAVLMHLDSGDGDIVYFNNNTLFTTDRHIFDCDSSLSYLASNGYIRDISDMIKEDLPVLNRIYESNTIFKNLLGYKSGIYGISFSLPYSKTPIALVRKNLVPDNTSVNTLDDVYTLIENASLKGDKYNIISSFHTFDIIDIFTNINNYYMLPARNDKKFGGYVIDEENDKIVRFEDTNIINDINNYYYYKNRFGSDQNVRDAMDNKNTGAVFMYAASYLRGSYVNDKYFAFPLYRDKKFQVNYEAVFGMVISSLSDKSKKAIELFEFLYSDKQAYNLASRLFPIYNEQLISYEWSSTSKFRNFLDTYIKSQFTPKYYKIVYNNYNILSEYKKTFLKKEENYGINERADIIWGYTLSKPDVESESFSQMVKLLKKTEDKSMDIYNTMQDIFKSNE